MAQRDMAKYPMAFLRYVEQLLFAIEEVRASGKPFSLQDLVQKHGALYGELQISNSQDSRSSALKSLSKVSPEDSLAYGHTLRFAVEKGLKPGMGFLNGRPLPLDATDESVGTVFGQEHNHVLGLVVQGKITDASPRSIYGFLVSGDRVYKSFTLSCWKAQAILSVSYSFKMNFHNHRLCYLRSKTQPRLRKSTRPF